MEKEAVDVPLIIDPSNPTVPSASSASKRTIQYFFVSTILTSAVWGTFLALGTVSSTWTPSDFNLLEHVNDVIAYDITRKFIVLLVLLGAPRTPKDTYGTWINSLFDFTTLCIIIIISKCWCFQGWHDPSTFNKSRHVTVIVCDNLVVGGTLFFSLLDSYFVNKLSNTISPRDWKLRGKSLQIILKPYFIPTGLKNKIYVVLTWLMVFASKVSDVVTPLLFGRMVSKLSSKPPQNITWELIGYCTLMFSPKVFTSIQEVLYAKVWQTAYAEVADATFRHVHSLSLEWHLKKKLGGVQRAMDRGLEAADVIVSYVALFIIPTIASSVATFIVFVNNFNQPIIASAAFLCLFLYCWVTYVITNWRKKYGESMNEEDNSMHDKATDSLINFETVKYFTNEEFEAKRYNESVKEFQQYSYKSQVSLNVLNLSQSGVQQICMCITLFIASTAIMNGRDDFSVADFVSIQLYNINIFSPLSYLGSIYQFVISSLINLQNLSDLLAETPDVVDKPSAKEMNPAGRPNSMNYDIEFKNVSFRYPAQTEGQGLRSVSFRIPAGTTTAIVGQTGSGKTTISRLLFRFYDVTEGEVCIGGQNIANITQQSLRRHIGIVPQDTVMFNDTVRYNILYGRVDATQKEVETATAQAQLIPFVEGLEKSWDTMVGERGLKLSGGEKQRVAIARCLLKNPPIVVLDEATSALDNKTEREVQNALQTFQGRTMVVIAHRLSTVRYADQIIVMKHGVVVEVGNHDTLFAKEGEYFEMWNAQLRKDEAPATEAIN